MSYSYGRPKPSAASIDRLPLIILFLAVAIFIAADLLLGFDFNWVDYAIVIVVALLGLKGYLKGLINTVFSLLGYVLGVIFAIMFSPKVALFAMEKTTLGKSIGEKINSLIPALSNMQTIKVNEAKSALDLMNQNDQFKQAMTDNPLLKQLISITHTAADSSAAYQENVVTVNDLLVFTLLKVLAIVVIFIVVKLLVILIGKLLTSVLNTSSILGTANRTAGMAVGLGVGLILVYIAFILFIPMLGSLNIVKLPENYSESMVLGWFNQLVLLVNGSR